MSNVQPTPITDKNGKQTTVHKRVAPVAKESRLNTVSPKPPAFYDDPNDSASEVYDRMTGGVKTLAGLIVTYAEDENFEQLSRLSAKMNALAETVDMWSKVSNRSKSLGEAKAKTLIDITDKMNGLTPEQEAEKTGYSLALDYLRSAEPVRIDRIFSSRA